MNKFYLDDKTLIVKFVDVNPSEEYESKKLSRLVW